MRREWVRFLEYRVRLAEAMPVGEAREVAVRAARHALESERRAQELQGVRL